MLPRSEIAALIASIIAMQAASTRNPSTRKTQPKSRTRKMVLDVPFPCQDIPTSHVFTLRLEMQYLRCITLSYKHIHAIRYFPGTSGHILLLT